MIATAIALQNATQEAVHDEMVMAMASQLLHNREEVDERTFAKMIFQYSAMLSSMTTTLVTNALLTESQLHDLLDTINEMESMGKEIEDGNE